MEQTITIITKTFLNRSELYYSFLKYCDIDLTIIFYKQRHEIALSLFIVVDNYMKSHLVAQAITDNKTAEVHKWILQQIKKTTNSAVPKVIITDTDSALDIAIV
ncbi:protein far1-related sequence 5-like [Gigaspora margarita]|uniref:Protein far1-related sequence 5-like n=1 Tax=Gigaspora margarita TaxID=4874 RepID=A0A8H3XFB4_GIGMA|nr:protein far1-related sequence 5-like [Gigaspora margarita]